MSEKSERAGELFQSFNCAQSVLAVFCEDYGLSEELALRVSGGFGGGFRCGELCGALSGAMSVLGLRHGQYLFGDTDTKAACRDKAVELIEQFRGLAGSVTCKELLGCDTSTEEGLAYAQEHDTHGNVCMPLVQNTVLLLEKMGY